MVMVLACASMLFSTNSAMALSGLACESAMIRMAFQSSPILNLPRSDSLDLAALVFRHDGTDLLGDCLEVRPFSARPQSLTNRGACCRARVAPERMGYSFFPRNPGRFSIRVLTNSRDSPFP